MSAWYCPACGRRTDDPDPAHPSLDPRFGLAWCACSNDPTKPAELVPATPDRAQALRFVDERRDARTYVRALRKQRDGRQLSIAEWDALAAHNS